LLFFQLLAIQALELVAEYIDTGFGDEKETIKAIFQGPFAVAYKGEGFEYQSLIVEG
jgi:hypothetical protein